MSTRVSAPPSRRWFALALIALAQFMVIMDTSIIGVALPKMQESLGFSQEGLSWVFNAYVIVFGGLLLLGGRLSDIWGARRVFQMGWVVLGAGSLAAGLAGSPAIELIGRGVQGAGAALIAPSALTLLMMVFGSNPKELTTAFAFYGAAAPAGGTAGVFLGGLITEYASWPWVFYINIPIAALAVVAAAVLVPGGAAASGGSVDVLGALTATLGLGAAVFAVVRAPEVGWGSGSTWGVLALAAILLAAFLVLQARRREPLMPLSIFRAPNLGAANMAQVLLGAAWVPMWFFLNLYLQQVLGYSAFPSGAALLPMTALIMVGMIAVSPKLFARFGARAVIVTGLLVLGAGLVWLTFIRADGNFWIDVLPGSLLAAFGMSLAFVPSLQTAISAARPEQGGLASGLVNTGYQIGSALGLAVVTAIASAAGADRIGDADALTDGFSAAFGAAAGIAVLAAALGWATFRSPARRERVPAGA
ncbi:MULTISPECIES: MFS transporter [Nocardia]|uniref:MFS transporter n=1 Tax=Nocardia TaxID=1817 RepID=UPI0007EB9E6D|nr:MULTISPECIES: MFS transporter [Nocardia]MBF6272070.1 MFS transporter [Nocardia nova]OBA45485.1 transporter [Nocardia sp. 852002-51101_SCH5132738]OBB50711.1 transporter [Nocardia sp. 852002-51244_SCH5132740]OBF80941.1 transporter [Mycobacterium sp. 852002-51759_SCH5129042]